MTDKRIVCLAVDDEPPALDVLKKFISSVHTLELAAVCGDAIEAINFLQSHPVDLIFLDIKMPELLGTDLIRSLQKPPKVIFTTAYRKYAVEGFELDAVDYLLKPISFDRFLKSVNKVLQINNKTDYLMPNGYEQNTGESSFMYFRTERKMVKVCFEDILFIEALKDYIKIITTGKTIVTKYVLSDLENVLPPDSFLRIHKSYIIATDKIESYNAENIQMRAHELPIGRLYKFNVTKTLQTTSKKDLSG